TAPSDYGAVAGTLSFAPGETSRTVAVAVNGDTTFEPDEGFTVDLSNAVHATISDAQGAGTVTNDDPQPSISVGDVAANEGDSGTTNFSFTVSLSNPSSQTVAPHYATADGTPTPPDDYA